MVNMNYGYRALVIASLWLLLMDVRCSSNSNASKTERLHSCLQNCANCVQFWEYGLYNGRRCANRCLRQQGREIVDPDCNDPKMFNYSTRIIEQLLEMRQMQADNTHDNLLMADAPAPDTRKKQGPRAKKRKHHKANIELDDVDDGEEKTDPRDESISERFQVEVRAEHLRRRKHNRNHNPVKSQGEDRQTPLQRDGRRTHQRQSVSKARPRLKERYRKQHQ